MRILILEDNPDHLELILEMLRESYGSLAQVHSCSLIKEATEYLNAHPVDIFLCDLQLPDSSVSETVVILRSIEEAPPIIVLTSLSDGELAQQLVKEGIQDYLPKAELSPSQLLRACNYAIERKKLARSLHDKNEDYRAFCYSLTHDFRSSLWQIARFAEDFKTETAKYYQEDSRLPWHSLDKVFSHVGSIQNLVDDLQDYLSLDATPTNLVEFELSAAVNNAVDMLADDIALKGARVNLHPLPRIKGSLAQMQLLFSNLISNSLKYNDKTTPTVDIKLAKQTDHDIAISISDNGIGMPEKLLGRIFTPFERLHSKDRYPGSGLGLSIVKRVAQYHGGKISVSSTEGIGTKFLLHLPSPKQAATDTVRY